MPSIYLPYVNIALDEFALIVTLIIFVVCVSEFSSKKVGCKHFLMLQSATLVALVADILGWIGEGRPSFAAMTVAANTVASCACQIAILGFMGYLIASLYANSRAATCILNIFRVFCAFSLLFCIGDAFFGYAFALDGDGHWHRSENIGPSLLYLAFPILSFFAVILLAFLAKSSAKVNRFAFFV